MYEIHSIPAGRFRGARCKAGPRHSHRMPVFKVALAAQSGGDVVFEVCVSGMDGEGSQPGAAKLVQDRAGGVDDSPIEGRETTPLCNYCPSPAPFTSTAGILASRTCLLNAGRSPASTFFSFSNSAFDCVARS